jgi:hypothetical protein
MPRAPESKLMVIKFITPSFIIQKFGFLERRTIQSILTTGKDFMKLIELVQCNDIPDSSKPDDARGKLVMAPTYSQHQPYSVVYCVDLHPV